MLRYAALLLIASLALGTAPASATAADERNSDIEVSVRVDGDEVHVAVEFTVDATPQEVWAVLTDFDHMAKFVSNLETSEVVARRGNVIRVHTKGMARFGPLQFPFEAVRELTLTPYERILSKQLSGTLRRFEGETRLAPAPQGGTRVSYRSDSTSNQGIPPIVGLSFIKSETEEQFHELQTEILRRRMEARKSK